MSEPEYYTRAQAKRIRDALWKSGVKYGSDAWQDAFTVDFWKCHECGQELKNGMEVHKLPSSYRAWRGIAVVATTSTFCTPCFLKGTPKVCQHKRDVEKEIKAVTRAKQLLEKAHKLIRPSRSLSHRQA